MRKLLLMFSFEFQIRDFSCPKRFNFSKFNSDIFPSFVRISLLRFILSSAHCTHGRDKNYMTIVAGTIKLNNDGKTFGVKQIIINPEYDHEHRYNDISLLRTAQKIHFSNLIQPILLPTHDLIENGKNIEITGWGFMRVFYSIELSIL